MNRSFRLYLIIFAIVLGLILILEANKTEIINWQKTFNPEDKNPFGLLVFDQESPQLFSNGIDKVYESPYSYFSKDSLQTPQNVLIINQWLTEESTEKLLRRAERGDYIFVISGDMYAFMADTLGLTIGVTRLENDNLLQLKDEKFQNDSLYIDKLAGGLGYTHVDSKTTRILGSAWNNDKEEIAVFTETTWGKGKIFMHSEPMFLTNYYMLNNGDYRYAEGIFSYLPDRKTIWFLSANEYVSDSPMRFILSQPALRYAWYIFLLSLPLFAFFHAKRRQRIIPVKEPLKNSSAEFVKTIGNLYLQEGNVKDMAHKKATYFLNKVRTDLMIDTQHLDNHFVHRLQLKTGAKAQTIEEVMPLLKKALHAQAPVQESELMKLNELLDKIYK